jgi:molybdopterin molybdotransferase
MVAPAEALSIILSHCCLQPVENVALAKALGRVLARPIRADRDMPPADRSTMDGYAVRADDLRSVPCELRLVGEVAAGSTSRSRVRPGTCVGIFTGANLPRGADAVAVVENTSEVSPAVICFRSKVERGENVLRRGTNARKGQVLLEKGARLGPQQIGVCASVGADVVNVYSQPRVGVLCTGEELVKVSARATRQSQRDSNGPALQAALNATGLARCKVFGVARDDPGVLRRKVREALKRSDVLLLVGGVSAGRYDFVPRVLKELGCREIFHGVAMKPGKPTLFALGPERQLVFGLPGNPLSALTGFYELVAPAVRKMSGLTGPPLAQMRVRLRSAIAAERTGRTRLCPAQLCFDPNDNVPAAVPVEMHGSADVVAGGRCDGMIVLPEDRAYEAGSIVEFHPWGKEP